MAKVTFLGHSCFLLEGGGKSLLIDPFLTDNPTASISAAEVSCDYIIVTHAHRDHFGDTLDIAKRNGAIVIANFEIATYCAAQGLEIHPLHIGGGASFPFGRAKLTIAHHGSSFPDGTYGGSPAGVTLTLGDRKIHHAGDTALTKDMELVGDEGIDLAMLPIGDNFTMGIDDAVRALDLIRPSQVIPMHYNTFDLIAADPAVFSAKAQAKGVECSVLTPGESLEI
ncbi:MAG: metal-dependent hydrolase [Acidobacteria bacterium]|nr:metal-dependent hydrolase [Acidobacteriota bacterium]